MSQPSVMPPRNLTLMEELEKLEQSITLTLQEIDHNFSRAHRIVTTSILPVIEQYAQHSNAVWQGSEFWKGFFEASANVKLSSYEEPAEGEETLQEGTHQAPQGQDYGTPSTHTGDEDTNTTPQDRPIPQYQDSSPMTSADATQFTPQRRLAPTEETSFAEYPSPYETLKREMTSGATIDRNIDLPINNRQNPTTPGFPKLYPTHTQDNPMSSPFYAATTTKTTTRRIPVNTGAAMVANADPILHRVLDKNYRIQATPLATQKSTLPRSTTATVTAHKHNPVLDFSSPFSPPMAAPQLRAEIFGSPIARGAPAVPRTPGISVQKGAFKSRIPTPRQRGAGDTANIFSPERAHAVPIVARSTHDDNIWDSDSDNGLDNPETVGMSPPKTMQFHIPASRLLRTPAREASKKIVADLLETAGMTAGSEGSSIDVFDGGKGKSQWEEDELELDLNLGDEEDDDDNSFNKFTADDDSPSVVRVARRDADADAF